MLVANTGGSVEGLQFELHRFFIVWIWLKFLILCDTVDRFQLVGVVLWLDVLIIIILNWFFTALLFEEVPCEQEFVILLQKLSLINLVSYF